MKNRTINIAQFLIIVFLLVHITNLEYRKDENKIKNAELIDQYLDIQIDNSELLEYINELDDEIKILSSCCANEGLNVNDLEYGD